MKRLFLLAIVTMIILCPVEAVEGIEFGINDVHTEPNQTTNKDSITIVVSGTWGIGPVLVDSSDFRVEGNSLELDIFFTLGYLGVITPWSHSEVISSLPANSYDLTVRAYVRQPGESYLLADTYSISFMVMIEADVEIEPKTVNLQGKGEWLNCHIWLPEDYNVADIESNSVVLESEPNDIYAEWIWYNEKRNIVMAKFNRSEVQQMLDVEDIEIDEAELTVSGELDNGIVFVGTDVIRVIDKGKGR
ncbi:MAG: hypothetical protein ACYSSO_08245 [Planctomycetota bacterium]